MDVLSLSGSAERLATTDAKSSTNAQVVQGEGVALPVFGALLALTRAAELTPAAEAAALAARQALAGDGKNLPPAILVEDGQTHRLPHAPHLPLGEVTQQKVQPLAQDMSSGPKTHSEANATLNAQLDAAQTERSSVPDRSVTSHRSLPSTEIIPMTSAPPGTAPAATGTAGVTTELVGGDVQQANAAATTRASNDGLVSGIALPTSSAAIDQVSVPGMRPTTLALPTRLDAPEWGESFASRVAWAANSNVQVAELRLNPPQLGHIGVHIAIQNNKADIAFATPHAEVLATIESALPRLRELFGESGVALGDVDVSQHGSSETPDRDLHPHAKFFAVHEATSETEVPLTRVHQGLIDHYV